jgi:hypothetical protein
VVVRDCVAANRFFLNGLQFELVEDIPSMTNQRRTKRWVMLRQYGDQSRILLSVLKT